MKEKLKLFMSKLKISKRRKVVINDYVSLVPDREFSDLLAMFEKLQIFFSGSPPIIIQNKDLNIFYRSLKIIISSSEIKSSELRYVIGNLQLELEIEDKETLIKVLTSLISESENKDEDALVSFFTVDLIFRCMVVIIRDCNTHLVREEVIYLKEQMYKYNNLMLRENIRRNY